MLTWPDESASVVATLAHCCDLVAGTNKERRRRAVIHCKEPIVIGTQRLPEKFSRNDMYLLISEYLSQHGRGE
jgi:hypothetical protein